MWQDLLNDLWDDGENVDFLAALGLGAVIGLGLALLFRPEPPTRRERIMKELAPYRKKLDKRAKTAKKAIDQRAASARKRGDEMVGAGRDVLDDLRAEVADIVADARKEIAAVVEGQVDAAQDALKKSAKRLKS